MFLVKRDGNFSLNWFKKVHGIAEGREYPNWQAYYNEMYDLSDVYEQMDEDFRIE
ncbi:MAG: hypothetical protein JRC57_05805 [Deltaproteobacteria bacterium]|nr:hypothetical protein [Deltaproteobacteria bacterium]MBW2652583.1 hypothetical protein [Deltaproteobacteria bacterium]